VKRRKPLRTDPAKTQEWQRRSRQGLRASRLTPAERRRRREVAEAAAERDGGCRLAHLGGCAGPLTAHHLRKSSSGGAYVSENIVSLCAFHNTFVEDHPEHPDCRALTIREGDPGFEELGERAQREKM